MVSKIGKSRRYESVPHLIPDRSADPARQSYPTLTRRQHPAGVAHHTCPSNPHRSTLWKPSEPDACTLHWSRYRRM